MQLRLDILASSFIFAENEFVFLAKSALLDIFKSLIVFANLAVLLSSPNFIIKSHVFGIFHPNLPLNQYHFLLQKFWFCSQCWYCYHQQALFSTIILLLTDWITLTFFTNPWLTKANLVSIYSMISINWHLFLAE